MASDRELTGDTVEGAPGQPPVPAETGEMELPLHARNRAAGIVRSALQPRDMVAQAREEDDA
ncbi:MAG: hypothetical protein F4080_07835, partial [Holophagales bacterium]|nr:hypothetical protein [Holophagales bacterium]